MQFDKPKVTIDLEEYQYLKEQEDKLKSDGFYNAARIILFAFSMYDRRLMDIRSYMANNGVSYSVSQGTSKIPSYEDITISYKPVLNK